MLTKKEQKAKQILSKALNEIEMLGVDLTQEFQVKIKENSEPSISDFRFKQVGQSDPIVSINEFGCEETQGSVYPVETKSMAVWKVKVPEDVIGCSHYPICWEERYVVEYDGYIFFVDDRREDPGSEHDFDFTMPGKNVFDSHLLKYQSVSPVYFRGHFQAERVYV